MFFLCHAVELLHGLIAARYRLAALGKQV